jgi:thymidylate synthase
MEERGFQPDKLMSAGCPPVLGVLLKRVTGTKLLWRSLVPLYAHSLKHFGMKNPYFRGKTVDDLLRYVLQSIEKYGEPVKASKGHTREITGVVLELTNPRARLSRTESRGKLFSCIGELCWYLKGTNKTKFIINYIEAYKKFSERGVVFGGYGPRLFKPWKGVLQFENVIKLLKARPTSRQAVLQLFDAADLAKPHKDVPCTCTLQLLQLFIRRGKLDLIVYMRSNDVITGLPHDIFCFTMLQEIAARTLSVELGIYKHCVGSLHLYDADALKAKRFLAEGWQSTKSDMPPMPAGDPAPGIALLLRAEAAVRGGTPVNKRLLNEEKTHPYWADLIRLLQVHSYKRRNKRTLYQRDLDFRFHNFRTTAPWRVLSVRIPKTQPTSELPVAREESERLSAADFSEEDFWPGG